MNKIRKRIQFGYEFIMKYIYTLFSLILILSMSGCSSENRAGSTKTLSPVRVLLHRQNSVLGRLHAHVMNEVIHRRHCCGRLRLQQRQVSSAAYGDDCLLTPMVNSRYGGSRSRDYLITRRKGREVKFETGSFFFHFSTICCFCEFFWVLFNSATRK